LMFGDTDERSPHEAFACFYAGSLHAVRDDRFKLVFPHKYRTLDGHPGGTGGLPIGYKMATAKRALYDLQSDIGETRDVAAKYPEVVKRLERSAIAFRNELGDRLTKTKGTSIRPPGKMADGDETLPLVW
ncbi:MAG: arylsulfatase, partial [Planctomycetota bacterium]